MRYELANLKIDTMLKDKNNERIRLKFDFLEKSKSNYYFLNNQDDYIYYYLDSIKVKAITIKIENDKNNDNFDEENILIYKLANFLEDYYYNLQRFEASLFYISKKIDKEKIGFILNNYNLSTENIHVNLNKKEHLFKEEDKNNNNNQLNYYLSNIFVYYHYYYLRFTENKSEIEMNVFSSIESFKNMTINLFKKLLQEEIKRFIKINDEICKYFEDVRYYDR